MWFSSIFRRSSETVRVDGTVPTTTCLDQDVNPDDRVEAGDDPSYELVEMGCVDDVQDGVECPSQTIASHKCIAVGSRFATCEVMLSTVKELSRSIGFRVGVNPHFFTKDNPHPIHGPGVKIWQRGNIYCTFKDPVVKTEKRGIKSTCTWSIGFTSDRLSSDYNITSSCQDHNHEIDNCNITPVGGLKQVTLDVDLCLR
uniref:Uncharacterized protein n=1 Tax=Spongospora subterranea TaxID=70186 RepID=A0A0H5QY31_9EUKA|eukprot:CRZ06885.1 hypothetical protein [Spongospora subterranea]